MTDSIKQTQQRELDIRLLNEAREEIERLRRHNEILSAKVEMIDLFAVVLHTRPEYPSRGMAEDVAWKIRKRVAQLEAPDAALGS